MYCNLGQKFMARKIIDSKVVTAIVIPYNDHATNFSSKYLCLYLEFWPALISDQRSFLLQLPIVNGEKKHYSKC